MRTQAKSVIRSRGIRALAACAGLFAGLGVCLTVAHAQTGVITTVVGPSLRGGSVSGDSLRLPTGVAVIGSGEGATVYTADAYNCVVWQTQGGQTSIYAGELGTCTGGSLGSSPTTTSLAYPVSLAACGGNLYVAAHGIDNSLNGFTSDVAASGQVYEIASNGTISQLPLPAPSTGGNLYPVALACDATGDVYVSSYSLLPQDTSFFGEVEEMIPSGTTNCLPGSASGSWCPVPEVSNLFDQSYPAIAVNPLDGDLYGFLVASGIGWLGTPTLGLGAIQNISASTAAAGGKELDDVSGMAIDGSGNFYISQANENQPGTYTSYVDEVTPGGATTILAGTGTPGYSGDGGPGADAQVDGVGQLAVDSAGYLYMADSENARIRRIHPLASGPKTLIPALLSFPQSSNVSYGAEQAAFNPLTGDFYYVSGANTVNVINAGASITCTGCERIFAKIPVGANNGSSASSLTLALDSSRNLIYVSNAADGNLYVIDGSTHMIAGSIAVNTASLSLDANTLIALDPGLNEVYVTAPYRATISAIRGGTSPQVLGAVSNLDEPIASMSVDTSTHLLYAVGEGTEGYGGFLEVLAIFTPDPTTGVAHREPIAIAGI